MRKGGERPYERAFGASACSSTRKGKEDAKLVGEEEVRGGNGSYQLICFPPDRKRVRELQALQGGEKRFLAAPARPARLIKGSIVALKGKNISGEGVPRCVLASGFFGKKRAAPHCDTKSDPVLSAKHSGSELRIGRATDLRTEARMRGKGPRIVADCPGRNSENAPRHQHDRRA